MRPAGAVISAATSRGPTTRHGDGAGDPIPEIVARRGTPISKSIVGLVDRCNTRSLGLADLFLLFLNIFGLNFAAPGPSCRHS